MKTFRSLEVSATTTAPFPFPTAALGFLSSATFALSSPFSDPQNPIEESSAAMKIELAFGSALSLMNLHCDYSSEVPFKAADAVSEEQVLVTENVSVFETEESSIDFWDIRHRVDVGNDAGELD